MDLLKKIQEMDEASRTQFIETIKTNGAEYNIFPLSNEQNSMWYLYQRDKEAGGNSYYNIAFEIEILGEFDISRLENVLNNMMEKNHILRSNFFELDNNVYQYIQRDYTSDFSIVDLTKTTEGTDVIIEKEIQEKLKRFNLEEELPIKFILCKEQQATYTLFISMHHIISDGWSVGLIANQLESLYFNDKAKLPDYQFGDYINWQQSVEGEKKAAEDLNYWIGKLKDAPHFSRLPTEYSRPENPRNISGTGRVKVEGELLEKIKRLNKSQRISGYSFFLSTLFTLILNYSKEKVLTVGNPVANRTKTEFLDVIGMFANSNALLLEANQSETFSELATRMNQEILEAVGHQSANLDKMIDVLKVQRENNQSPLFQVLFAMQDNRMYESQREKQRGDLVQFKIRHLNQEETENFSFDLAVTMIENKTSVEILFGYSKDLYSPNWIESIMDAYHILIEGIVADPHKDVMVYPLAKQNVPKLKIGDYQPSTLVPVELPESLNLVGDVAILDHAQKIMPIGFEGEIYLNQANKWFRTYDRAFITPDLQLSKTIKYKEQFIETLTETYSLDDVKQEICEASTIRDIYITYRKTSKGKNIVQLFYEADEDYGIDFWQHYIEVDYILSHRFIKLAKNVWNDVSKHVTEAYEAAYLIPLYDFIEKTDSKDLVKDVYVLPKWSGPYELICVIPDKTKLDSITEKFLLAELNPNRFILKSVSAINYRSDGTIDYAQLVKQAAKTQKVSATAHSETEETLFKSWAHILGHENFTIFDNLVEIGGNSLLAVQLLYEINQTFEINLNIVQLLDAISLYQLAQLIDNLHEEPTTEKVIEGLKF